MNAADLVDLAQKWFGRLVGNPHASLKVLAQNYGIEIDTEAKPTGHLLEDNDRQYAHERPSQAQLQPAYMLLRSELALYPVSVIKASKLERIILCSNMHRDDLGLNGRFSCQSGIIYFSVDRIVGTETRRSFHHEFFHCIDWNDDHWRYRDPVWIRLNEPRFAYAGRQMEQQSGLVRRIGFVTNYAMKEVWEDKAELYSHMIMHYDWVKSRTVHDPILKTKFERMKELLRTFSAAYDDDFWDQRHQHSVAVKDDGGIIVKIKVQEKDADPTVRMWLLTRQDDSSIKPIELDSENMLAYCLSKLGISEFEEIDGLNGNSKKAEVNVRVPQPVLKELGLS